jgi:uncharacterized OB-fold protein
MQLSQSERREPDPRPRVVRAGDGLRIAAWRCAGCQTTRTEPVLRCGRCGGTPRPASLSPQGTLWSWTTPRVGVDSGVPVAYLDLDDGGRLLVRLAGPSPLAVGARVEVTGETPDGDLIAEVLR